MRQDVDNNKTIKQLLESYLNTNYRVQVGDQEILLQIGQRQPLLDALLQQSPEPMDNWAVISGHNPGSRVQTSAVNHHSNRLLEAKINALGLVYWPETAGDCQHDFPDEDGFLIAGINYQQLAELAVDFGQNAVVYGRLSSVARLLIFPQIWKSSQALTSLPEYVDNYCSEKDDI